MPCYSPLHGFRSKTPTQSGKRKVVFQRKNGLVDMPMSVPCGVCIGCRIDKARQWALRCTHEAKLHERCSFVTLTFNDESMPRNLSLDKFHLQQFFRALRYEYGPFRYFAAGEYSKDNRPHYHILLFGLNFDDDRKKHSTNKYGDVLYISDRLSKVWTNGYHLIGGLTYQTASYTARYVIKKIYGPDAGQHENYTRLSPSTGEVWQVEREFILMSRRPGIGSGWYDKFHKDAFPSDCLIADGKKFPVPRYYLEKLKKADENKAKSVTTKRKKARKDDAVNNTPDRLAVREICVKARMSHKSRRFENET